MSRTPLSFYVGLHHPSDAQHFARACLSVRTMRARKARIPRCRVLLDSGAFTELSLFGEYRTSVEAHAAEIARVAELADVVAAVAQDYMCEPFMVERTGLSVAEHQRLTIERYDALLALAPPVPIIPVLQGYDPTDYVRHLELYGGRLEPDRWTGVGSVCKRNGSPRDVAAVLAAIKCARPDLRLHGFGIKKTALADPDVRSMLFSADSMAWSYFARKNGRNPNDRGEAQRWLAEVEATAARAGDGIQLSLPQLTAWSATAR